MKCCFQCKPVPSSWLAGLFLLLAVPYVIFLATIMPPFQGPDELHHFYRAFQVAEGGLSGDQPGLVDPNIKVLSDVFTDIRFKVERPTSKLRKWRSDAINWSSTRAKANFTNTAAYTPLHYLPQAGGILLGRAFGWNIRDSLVLCRMCTGLAAAVLCALAVYLCGRGRYLLFTVLLLPMSLSLYASANQDGTIIPVMALAVGLLSRILTAGRAATNKELAVLAGAVLFVVLGRPPYAPFVLLFFLPGLIHHPRARLIGLGIIAGIFGLSLLWYVPQAFEHAVNHLPQTDAKKQLSFLIQASGNNIWFVFNLLWDTLKACTAGYGRSFIGYLGWFDTLFPGIYYGLANAALVLAVVADVFTCETAEKTKAAVTGSKRQKIVLFCICLFALVGLFFAEYLMGTQVGKNLIAGLQGRYLIPIALLFSLSLPQCTRAGILGTACAVLVLAFPLLVTAYYLPRTVVYRYYLASHETDFSKPYASLDIDGRRSSSSWPAV